MGRAEGSKAPKKKFKSGSERSEIIHCRATAATLKNIDKIRTAANLQSLADAIEFMAAQGYREPGKTITLNKLIIDQRQEKIPKARELKGTIADLIKPVKKKSLFKKQLELPLQDQKALNRKDKRKRVELREDKHGVWYVYAHRTGVLIKSGFKDAGAAGDWTEKNNLRHIAVLPYWPKDKSGKYILGQPKKAPAAIPVPKKLQHIKGLQRFTYKGIEDKGDRKIFTDQSGSFRFLDTCWWLLNKEHMPVTAPMLSRMQWKNKFYYGVPVGHASVNIYLE
jgi:hypothetical protein